MRERSKRRKLVSAAMILCILAAMLSGCGKSDRESYASAEEAKQAMNQCRTFVVEGDLEDVNQEGDILAEEHGKELYNYDGSQIGSGKADLKGYFLKECYTEIDTDPGVSVDAVDKMAMYLQLFSKFNETAGD